MAHSKTSGVSGGISSRAKMLLVEARRSKLEDGDLLRHLRLGGHLFSLLLCFALASWTQWGVPWQPVTALDFSSFAPVSGSKCQQVFFLVFLSPII